jgi:cytochrome o ubiquinol oxidase operon protein cyoD
MNHASMEPIESAGAGEGTLKSYAIGFVLSVVLTAIPFGLVLYGALSSTPLVIAIFSAAVAQIGVHLYYFLHLNTSSKAQWNLLALLFTILIMVLIVGGTLWIMYHLHYRMM